MEYTAENLERVVTVFYRSEAGQQAQAHQWLTEAQNAPQAWSFVWELLQPHRSSEVQFFAATTLHTKLLKHWNEVPTDHYEQLKKKIVENIINYAMGPKIVLNRLCIALSAYIIHTIPNHWPNAFEELVSSFQPQNLPNINSERVVWILLEILTVIPEEFQSTTLPNTQKIRVRTVLQEVSRDILKVIEMCLLPAMNDDGCGWSAPDMTTWTEAARCAGAWLQLGGARVSECGELAAALVQLMARAYWRSAGDTQGDELELLEAAGEALGALLAHPLAHKHPALVARALRDMLQHLGKLLAAEQAKAARAQNKDVLCCVFGLLVSAGDAHSKLLVTALSGACAEQRALALGVLRAALACSAAPGRYPLDESASALAFGFWYTLQDDALALDEAAGARALALLRPLYRELVGALLRKAAHPLDAELRRFSADDRELFRCYRQDIADTLMYCHSVLNAELLDLLDTQLNRAVAECRADADAWPEVESCLHAYYAIAEAVDVEDVYLPRLMERLQDIPYERLSVKVLGMALDTFGAYAEWITEHPATLASAVPFLTAGLAVPAVAASATMALKDLTHNCQRFLAPYAPLILQGAHAALGAGHLRLAECVRLMFSIGKVLSVLGAAEATGYAQLVLAPHLDELQALASGGAAGSAGGARAATSRLKLVAALFCALHVGGAPGPEQPVLVVARAAWPLWRALAARWVAEPELMEVLCTVLKHIVTTLGEASSPLTAELLQLLGTAYRAAPQPSVLLAARPLLLLWGRGATPLLTELTAVTLALCAGATADTLAEHGDVLEAFFQMQAQLAKKNPRLLLEEGVDPAAIFQCASMCLTMNELQVLKACASFLTNFIGQSREISLSAVVINCGEQLVGRVLLNLGGAAPRSAVEPMAELLLALNKKYCENLARWLNGFLGSDDGFPSVKITKQQKEMFIKTVLREKANKRKLTESVLEFTLICRGILRQETTTT